MTVYFTSDLHLGHEDVLAFAQRPWSSIEEHDSAIIDNINATVGDGDELYILGDFTFCMDEGAVRAYLDAIACRNRWLIIGNHDNARALFEPGAFVEACQYKERDIEGCLCCLSHYPIEDWGMSLQRFDDEDGVWASIMLHGHIHSCKQAINGDNARAGIWRYDVGVDANDYRPVSFEEICDFIAARDPSFP